MVLTLLQNAVYANCRDVSVSSGVLSFMRPVLDSEILYWCASFQGIGLVTVLFRAFESNIALKEKNDGKWTQ